MKQNLGPLEMSLRDYFAAQIMPGLLATIDGPFHHDRKDWEVLSSESYKIADAMLAERGRK